MIPLGKALGMGTGLGEPRFLPPSWQAALPPIKMQGEGFEPFPPPKRKKKNKAQDLSGLSLGTGAAFRVGGRGGLAPPEPSSPVRRVTLALGAACGLPSLPNRPDENFERF